MTFQVLQVTADPVFNYFFSVVVVWLSVLVPATLVLRILSRS